MISFIIPVFSPDYEVFKKCLKSLKEQSLKDWEGIIVLDGPDSQAEMIAEMAGKKFKVVEIPHGGAQKARNEGFKHSKGDIVCFWDCDCLIEPDTAKMWVDMFTKYPEYDFVYSGYKFLGENGGIASEPFDPWLLRVSNYISTCFPMRRGVFPGWDETLKSLQDWDMWLTIVERGSKGLFVPGFAFSTKLPDVNSISGKGCPTEVWNERVKAVKVKHDLPYRKVCVSSLGNKTEGIRLAKLIEADYIDYPGYKPNNYEAIIQVGFSLHPNRVGKHIQVFNQPLKKKIIFWTMADIEEMHNQISLKALELYSERLNLVATQYCEDVEAKKVLEYAGFKAEVMPMPMVHTGEIEPLPEKPRWLVDSVSTYQSIIEVVSRSLPDMILEPLNANKEIKDYTGIISLFPERTMTFEVKRMLNTGRSVVSNMQNPFCGYVSDNNPDHKIVEDLVNKIRTRANRNNGPQISFCKSHYSPAKLLEVLK